MTKYHYKNDAVRFLWTLLSLLYISESMVSCVAHRRPLKLLHKQKPAHTSVFMGLLLLLSDAFALALWNTHTSKGKQRGLSSAGEWIFTASFPHTSWTIMQSFILQTTYPSLDEINIVHSSCLKLTIKISCCRFLFITSRCFRLGHP